MQERTARFAIIGAGPVGLAIAKSLGQRSIPYDQLEADLDLGGNWLHGVYSTAHIISSKKTTEYSDFPMPDDYPDFPSRVQMLSYLRSYADHFNLRGQIEFETKVVMIRPLERNGWELELASGERRVYKGVVVCNGHHWDRRFPSYPGRYTGEFIHSKDYRGPEQLEDRRVLVIGGGNSACDIAAEAARVSDYCQISLRRGYWFLPKTIFGVPFIEMIPWWMPVPVQRFFLRLILRVIVGRYEQYGLPRPDHRIFEAHPTVNSELLHYLKHGRIRARPDVAGFEGKRVVFTDGTMDEFDLVICATGFKVSFPFLPPDLIPVEGGVAKLHAGVVLADYKHLYVLGTSQPRYGFGPLVTLGGDLLARLIKLQDEMELPVGRVLAESGDRLPTTHLINPHAAMRRMKLARILLPVLAVRERFLRRRLKQQKQPALVIPAESNPSLKVF
ncbi:MAG: NAD(P)-binding domain-containing protein [Acidobacteriota bacterium]